MPGPDLTAPWCGSGSRTTDVRSRFPTSSRTIEVVRAAVEGGRISIRGIVPFDPTDGTRFTVGVGGGAGTTDAGPAGRPVDDTRLLSTRGRDGGWDAGGGVDGGAGGGAGTVGSTIGSAGAGPSGNSTSRTYRLRFFPAARRSTSAYCSGFSEVSTRLYPFGSAISLMRGRPGHLDLTPERTGRCSRRCPGGDLGGVREMTGHDSPA